MSGASIALAETYGFGGLLKRSVTVERHLAPDLQLANVSIDVDFPRGTGGLDGQTLRSQLETDLARGGQNISLQDHDPDMELRLEVTSYDRPHVDRQTQNGTTTYTATGDATITFQLVHHPDGRVVYAGTESWSANHRPPVPATPATGAGRFLPHLNLPNLNTGTANQNTTDNSLALQLTNELSIEIASHFVVTNEPIPMLLARGPGLDDPDKLAEAKRWNEDVEALSTMTPASSPADDAYRLYNLGVANEALGYAADDPKTTLKYLREASVQYTKAMEDRSSEKYFTDCQMRIEKAIARYNSIEALQKQTAQRDAENATREQHDLAHKKAGSIDNSDVIRLVQAGVDPSIVSMKIKTAPLADFDLSTDGLVALSKAGVRANLINEMVQRMQAPAVAAKTAPSTPTRR